MIHKVSAKGFRISAETRQVIDHYTRKLRQRLPHWAADLPLLNVVVRKHLKFFDGAITLHLPPTPLDVHFQSDTATSGIRDGFEKILDELRQYRSRKYPGHSEYPHLETIRRRVEPDLSEEESG